MRTGGRDSYANLRTNRWAFQSVRRCGQCGLPVDMWLTQHSTPVYLNPRHVPGNDEETAVFHKTTCKPAPKPEKEPKPQAPVNNREQYCRSFAARTGARLVVALYDDGPAISIYRLDIPGEELKQDLITEANRIARTKRSS